MGLSSTSLVIIADKHNLDRERTTPLFDRVLRDLGAFKKSGKEMTNTEHPLYKMANSLIEYDIRAEAKLVMKPAAHLMNSEKTPTPNTPYTKPKSTGKAR